MKLFKLIVAGCLVLGLQALGQAADKATNKEKIVGVWTPKSKEGEKVTIEFTKDGKIIINAEAGEKKIRLEGTYAVDGESIKMTLKEDDKERKTTVKIITLNDKMLVTEDDKGKKDEFTRSK
jgi:uncharacterized protein (TIGR03066 family)